MNENQAKPETWDFLNLQNKDRQLTPSRSQTDQTGFISAQLFVFELHF